MRLTLHCLLGSFLCSAAFGEEPFHVRALVTAGWDKGLPNYRKFLDTIERDVFPQPQRSFCRKFTKLFPGLKKPDPRITTQLHPACSQGKFRRGHAYTKEECGERHGEGCRTNTKQDLLKKLDVMVSEANYTTEDRTLLFYYTGHGSDEGMWIDHEKIDGDMMLSKIHTVNRKGISFIAITESCGHGNLMDLPLKLQHPDVSSVSWKGIPRDGPLILHIASCKRAEVSATAKHASKSGFKSFTKTLCEHGPDLSRLIEPQYNMNDDNNTNDSGDRELYKTLDHYGTEVYGQTPMIACTQPLDFKKLGGLIGFLKMLPTELFIQENEELTNRVKSKYLTDFEDHEDSDVSDDSDDSQLDAKSTDDSVNLSQVVVVVGVVLSALALVSYILM